MQTRKHLRILLIEDHGDSAAWMRQILVREGYDVAIAHDGADAVRQREAAQPDLILMDLRLPDIDGLDLLERFKAAQPDLPVVMVTAHGSVTGAVDAMKRGAFNFIEKPVDVDVLLAVIEKAADYLRLRDENKRLRQQVREEQALLGGMVTKSEMMRQVFSLIRSVAPTDANVLIAGENGTGKELVANALHQFSARAHGPLVKINCAAIPAELIESELFGHRRGAFTGAIADKIGLMEQAHGGTLMLDEIGEMPLSLQAKLLRVLQERQVTPVGGTKPVQLDFRLICATNIDLHVAMAQSKFREDLYFRVNTIAVKLPPLRDRPEDIPLLAAHFVKRFAKQYSRPVASIHPDAFDVLMRHPWRGNVRELEHVIERAVIVAEGNEILIDHLPDHLLTRVDLPAPALAHAVGASGPREVAAGSPASVQTGAAEGAPPITSLDDLEKWAIVRTLKHTRGNKRAAASILGIHRPTLYKKLQRYGLADEIGTREVEPELAR